MKAFFERYSYDSVRMALNQIAIAIFGFALGMTSVKAESDTLMLVTSIGAILFYLALNYGVAFRVGSRDKITVDRGLRTYRPLTGLWIALLANSVNLLLAVLITIGTFVDAGNLMGISRFIALFLQGMYLGVLKILKLGGQSLNEWWFVYFLTTVPSLLVGLIGYITGIKDLHITRMGVPDLPESDRPTKQELKEKKKEDRK